jgi:hypothetical protein
MPNTSHYEVKVTNYAFDNLTEIHRFISEVEQKPITANQVIESIEKTISELIPVQPYRYPECPARRTQKRMYRQALIKNFKVIFRITEKMILVIAIVHASRGKSYIRKIPLKS